eukprot:GDKJ01025597.1.p1 GENE.GDKJ01025597.1~~GDKJ01025597.1.p1  ORF type:complete len:654 (-),score=145.95 GDKJ01025597.1:118-2079(-)
MSSNDQPQSLFETFKKSFSTAGQEWHAMNAHPFEEGSNMIPHGKDALNYKTGEVFSFDSETKKWSPSGQKINVSYYEGAAISQKTIPTPSTEVTEAWKNDRCEAIARPIRVPGSNTLIHEAASTPSGRMTHFIQPHETISVTGDTNSHESTRQVTDVSPSMRFTEHSSDPQFILQEKPVFVMRERPVYIEKPIYIERPVEKPVIVEKTIDRPVYIEKVIEKPVIIEKTVERPVYIVHETPGNVVIDREMIIRDDRHKLTQSELKAFAESQGLVHDDRHKIVIAAPHQLHFSEQQQLRNASDENWHRHAIGNANIAPSQSSLFFDKRGHSLQSVTPEEWDRLHSSSNETSSVSANSSANVLRRPSTFPAPTNANIRSANENEGISSWRLWTPLKWVGGLFSSSGEPEAQWLRDSASKRDAARATTSLNIREATAKEAPTQAAPSIREITRDRRYLMSGGLLENASSSAAEHYYRFGTCATVDHPTDPLELEAMVTAASRKADVPFVSSVRSPWISQQGGSSFDSSIRDHYLAASNEIVPPSHPHATLNELGRVLASSSDSSPIGVALGEISEGAAKVVSSAVEVSKDVMETAKRGVVKTVDVTLEGIDKVVHKAHDQVHDTTALKAQPAANSRSSAAVTEESKIGEGMSSNWWM